MIIVDVHRDFSRETVEEEEEEEKRLNTTNKNRKSILITFNISTIQLLSIN